MTPTRKKKEGEGIRSIGLDDNTLVVFFSCRSFSDATLIVLGADI